VNRKPWILPLDAVITMSCLQSSSLATFRGRNIAGWGLQKKVKSILNRRLAATGNSSWDHRHQKKEIQGPSRKGELGDDGQASYTTDREVIGGGDRNSRRTEP